jgi:hypothetical protein
MATPDPIAAGQDPAPAPAPNGSGDPGLDPGAALPDGGVADPAPAGASSSPALPGPATSPIGLTGELAEDPRLSKFQDVEGLAKSYVELEQASANSIRIPGEAASDEMRQEYLTKLMKHAPELMVKPDKNNPEQMAEFYRTMGRPEDADKYTVPELRTPDGEPVDPAGADALRGIAYEANLTDEQFSKVVQGITDANIELEQQGMQAWSETIVELKKEWGNAYPDKYRRASEVAHQTGAPPEVMELLKTGYVSSDTLRWLDQLGQILGPEGGGLTKQPDGDNPRGGITPGEAQAQLDEMMNNKQHPLWDSHHPDHARAVQRRLELQKAINPEASTDLNDLRSGGGSFDS